VVSELQGKKVDEAEVVISDEISNELVGVLQNSITLSNYEHLQKGTVENDKEEKEEEREEEDKDERSKKKEKRISFIDIDKEDYSFMKDKEFKFWDAAAKATEVAK